MVTFNLKSSYYSITVKAKVMNLGKTTGTASLISLFIVIFSIIKIIISYIKPGHNPTLITIIVCIFLLIINNRTYAFSTIYCNKYGLFTF